MSDTEYKVRHATRCLLVPMSGDGLLVPNVMVVEIINFRSPTQKKKSAKDWLLGNVRWRNLDVPVISYEKMIGDDYQDAGQRRRIVICHSFNGNKEPRFIGIVAQGLPRLVSVDEGAVAVLNPVKGKANKPIYSHVSVGGNQAFIPEMEKIGDMVAKV